MDLPGSTRTLPAPASLREWVTRLRDSEVLIDRTHGRDFAGSRAEYITARVRLMAFVMAALTLSWIPVDLTLFPADQALPMMAVRLIAAAAFVLLGVRSSRTLVLPVAQRRLGILIAIPITAYALSRVILGDAIFNEGVFAGYFLVPFLLASLPAGFPVTLAESTVLALIVMGTVAVMEYSLGNPLALFTQLGVIAMLAPIAAITGMSQLSVLLTLYREATVDPLTGLANRRLLMQQLEVEMSRARRYGRPFSVIMIDLDHFKRVNDEHGHLAGDVVLATCSSIINSQLREFDAAGRFGGEEFLVMLPETETSGGQLVAERMRHACQEARSVGPHGEVVGVSVSAGVATMQPGDDPEKLIARVDSLLYDAKRNGRNCCVSG